MLESRAPLDLHKSRKREGAAKSKVERRPGGEAIKGIPGELVRARARATIAFTMEASRRRFRGSFEPSNAVDARFMADQVEEFLVLFMARCSTDDRLENMFIPASAGLHLVDSAESNSALRGMLCGGRAGFFQVNTALPLESYRKRRGC